jgi:hypothetical protein
MVMMVPVREKKAEDFIVKWVSYGSIDALSPCLE